MTTTSLRYVHAHESAQIVSPDSLRQPFQVYVSPSMMPEVCNKVAIEPHLQPITSEEMSCASQHPGWCLSTPRMVPLNTQNGASQHPEWCLSIPRMVPLNTQNGASINTRGGTSTSTQDWTRLDVAADSFWTSRFERAFFDLRVSHPFSPSNQQS